MIKNKTLVTQQRLRRMGSVDIYNHNRGQITRLGEMMRKHKLLTQVVHSTAYSYTLVADFGGEKRK